MKDKIIAFLKEKAVEFWDGANPSLKLFLKAAVVIVALGVISGVVKFFGG